MTIVVIASFAVIATISKIPTIVANAIRVIFPTIVNHAIVAKILLIWKTVSGMT